MSSEFSVGIIGAGAVVRERHLPALAGLRGVRLAWISDPLPEARDRVAALHGGGVPTSDDPAELLAGTDAVLVATPPAAHAARAVQALEAGCHVLCEKPLALDADACRQVAAAAQEAGRTVTVAFNLRHHPAAVALRAAVADGSLGRAVAVRSCSSSPGRQGTTGWVGDRALGGDVLWEVGSHHADLWRFVLGEEIVEATGHASPDVAVISARTDAGTPISATILWGAGPQNELEVLGERARGRAGFYGADPIVVTPTEATGAEPPERLRSAARMLRAAPGMVRTARGGGAFQATYAAEWAAFLDAARGLAPNPCPVQDGLAAAQVVRMLQEACDAGAGRDAAPIS